MPIALCASSLRRCRCHHRIRCSLYEQDGEREIKLCVLLVIRSPLLTLTLSMRYIVPNYFLARAFVKRLYLKNSA